jgi:hypothetical protein
VRGRTARKMAMGRIRLSPYCHAEPSEESRSGIPGVIQP